MNSIEIYIENASVNEVVEWLIEYFYVDSQEEIDDGCFKLTCREDKLTFPVIVRLGVENGIYTGVWFNTDKKLWETSTACAESAHKFLSKSVLCEPEQDNQVPNLFLKISNNGKEIVTIENT